MSAPQVFALPDLGEGLIEAEIVEWLVAEGDEVTVDQHVVTVETAKAAVEIPCPYAGTVASLHGEPGQLLEVGAPLITISSAATPAGTGADGGEPRADSGGFAADSGGFAADSGGSGNVLIGYGTSTDSHRTPRAQRRAPAYAAAVARAQPDPAQPGAVAVKVISPLVRRLAHDAGLDLSGITPSHADGIIRRADVVQAAGSQHDAPQVAAEPGELRIPMTGMRRVMADRVSLARREIPDATTWVDVDATELLALRDTLRSLRPGDDIGVLALVARIVVAGLHRFPELNASVDTGSGEIVQHRSVHLGFAAQSPRGLLVPVVKESGSMSTAELAAELRRLTYAAREGSLTPGQLTGGTFTLNNYGVLGVDGSTPIINHPEAAMLGVGRIIDRPWAHEGQVALRKVGQLSLTFDHRVCDGGSAGGFLRFVADCVEQPALLLGSL